MGSRPLCRRYGVTTEGDLLTLFVFAEKATAPPRRSPPHPRHPPPFPTPPRPPRFLPLLPAAPPQTRTECYVRSRKPLGVAPPLALAALKNYFVVSSPTSLVVFNASLAVTVRSGPKEARTAASRADPQSADPKSVDPQPYLL